jgi:pyrroloquinoline quinone (PQQ) biosynthesis protein C
MATGYRQEADLGGVEWNVLEHPFCARWATGELSFEELALYASEYEHAVWRAFSRAVGWGGMAAWTYGEDPLPETEVCARSWEGKETRTLAEHVETLRAIDAVQGPVSEVMLNGLLRHYGFEEGAATDYFRLHAGLAGESRSAAGEEVRRSYWFLLDGVERLAGR